MISLCMLLGINFLFCYTKAPCTQFSITMKKLILLAIVASACSTTYAQHGQVTFDKLKSLEGEWRGVRSDGVIVLVSYEITSGGTALVERHAPKDEPEMLTVYHMDGEDLIMTHYCAIGNQPRMREEKTPSLDDDIVFRTVNVTNYSADSEGHMSGLDINFSDHDHLKQTWTWRSSEGKETPASFDLRRVH